MKRSEINATIKKMEALLDECRFKLPTEQDLMF